MPRSAALVLCLAVLQSLSGFPASAGETLPIVPAVTSVAVDGSTGQRILSIELSPDGTKALADFTTRHVGRELQLRIDGKTVMQAVLREPITGGRLQLSGATVDQELRGPGERGARKVLIELEVLGD